MIFSDVYVQARAVFGNCDFPTVCAKTSDAINLLRTKAPGWDAMMAEMTICNCQGTVTLPRDVETPVALATNGIPSIARDKNYIYHINGTGPRQCFWASPRYWDDCGEAPTFRDILTPSVVIAEPVSASDNGKSFIIFGTDAFNAPLRTINADGTSSDGLLLPMNASPAIASPIPVLRISRIVKSVTNQFVNLWSVDPATNQRTLLGAYAPDETEPNYRRIRVQCKSSVRFRYRRRFWGVTNLNDFIPLDSKIALVLACKAIKAYENDQPAQAEAYEQQATRLCNEEQRTRNAQSGIGPQVDVDIIPSHEGTMYDQSGWNY